MIGDYTILILSWVAFYSLHSLLASDKLTRKYQPTEASRFNRYRLLFSLFFTIFLLVIMVFSVRITEDFLFEQSRQTIYIGLLLTTVGVLIIKRAFRHMSVRSFLGLQKEQQGKKELVIQGAYAWVRHPIYSGTLLIFIGYLIYYPTGSSLIHLLMTLVYLPIGIRLEEQKLTALFGEDYLRYKTRVKAVIPRLL
ncbi:methyltransferase family protein [Penaeicola halotolerans]|uniref:methyltransferase family protein n=1 Tax=Penaeicola halotolerans TaxID=2793196 RepID=UPI001CF83401|nr:isoprenylcysteine carboxylmethyltransferase family protein [Penaeicola halotolerans]